MNDREIERAKERILWYLDRSDRTERELRERLKRGGFSGEVTDAAIERLKGVGLIDDRRYAINMAQRLSDANVSRRESYSKLMAKGIERELIIEALDSADADEQKQIAELLRKKYSSKLSGEDGIKKVYAALLRKGFSYGAVRDALKQYSEELECLGEDYV